MKPTLCNNPTFLSPRSRIHSDLSSQPSISQTALDLTGSIYLLLTAFPRDLDLYLNSTSTESHSPSRPLISSFPIDQNLLELDLKLLELDLNLTAIISRSPSQLGPADLLRVTTMLSSLEGSIYI